MPSEKRERQPYKLTVEITEKIAKAIENGAYIETAAAFAGISKVTFYAWLKRGERENQARLKLEEESEKETKETPCGAFKARLDRAMANSEMSDLRTISRFADGFPTEKTTVVIMIRDGAEVSRKTTTETSMRREWQAAAWRLERKHPERWGRRFELAGPGGEALAGAVKIYLPDNHRRRPPGEQDAAAS